LASELPKSQVIPPHSPPAAASILRI
jgi:hypothetical protein